MNEAVFKEHCLDVLAPLDQWAQRCHEASLKLVKSGILGSQCRVARGSCKGVGGQHSWVVLGRDCYDDNAQLIDPTLWSYRDDVDGIWIGGYKKGWHRPHGKGSIWEFGRPQRADELGELVMALTPSKPWSNEARAFLAQLGPMGKEGWIRLAHYPVEGWPAAEIIEAMIDSGLGGYVPIDIIGMLTDRKPDLYLP